MTFLLRSWKKQMKTVISPLLQKARVRMRNVTQFSAIQLFTLPWHPPWQTRTGQLLHPRLLRGAAAPLPDVIIAENIKYWKFSRYPLFSIALLHKECSHWNLDFKVSLENINGEYLKADLNMSVTSTLFCSASFQHDWLTLQFKYRFSQASM